MRFWNNILQRLQTIAQPNDLKSWGPRQWKGLHRIAKISQGYFFFRYILHSSFLYVFLFLFCWRRWVIHMNVMSTTGTRDNNGSRRGMLACICGSDDH
jgi:hypothetical protein